ncbi:zinc ribbon domain-containing protein [Dactylosporangium sp. CA-092794]|uniref:zinc ribbon domain-containing protein n=1 Tax=Dactylosporangium sp. CA-092794 TaxID=3239929 RepID=UPI003D8F604F
MNLPAPAPGCPHCGAATRPDARFCRACGRPLSGDPAPVAPDEVAPVAPDEPASTTVDAPLQRRRLRRRIIIGGALVLAVISGYLTAITADRVLHQPERSVRAFFAALTAKDTAAIRALTNCRYGPLCEPGALDAGYVPPAGLEITDVRYGSGAGQDEPTRLPDRSSVAVLVRYQAGGKSFDDVIALRRGGWFDDWTIAAAPGWPLVLTSAQLPKVRVAAATVAAGRDNGQGFSGKAWALPGVYTVTVADDPLYTADPITLTVGGSAQETRISPVARLRDDLAAEVNRQVKERIDACAGQETVRPDTDPALLSGNDCPFSALDRYTITRNVTWRVTRYPQLTLAVGDARPVLVRTVTEGEALVSYDWSTDILEPRRWTAFSETVAFSVGGQAATGDDGKVVWTP